MTETFAADTRPCPAAALQARFGQIWQQMQDMPMVNPALAALLDAGSRPAAAAPPPYRRGLSKRQFLLATPARGDHVA